MKYLQVKIYYVPIALFLFHFITYFILHPLTHCCCCRNNVVQCIKKIVNSHFPVTYSLGLYSWSKRYTIKLGHFNLYYL